MSAQNAVYERLIHNIKSLPTLPTIALEILQSIGNEKISTSQLSEKVANDIGIASRVLRVANSPFFGLSCQISSLKQGITLIGLNSLSGLVTSASVMQLFKQTDQFNLKNFWEHSLHIASCAKVLANHVNVEPETAFTTGLLHDIGILVLALSCPEQFTRMHFDIGTTAAMDDENTLFGINHADFGGMVAKHWHFPDEVIHAISTHHHLSPDDVASDLARVIYVSSLYAEFSTQGEVFSPELIEFKDQAHRLLGIPPEEVEDIIAEVEIKFQSVKLLISP